MKANFDEIDAIRCPCGFARRAFVTDDNSTATMHIVEIVEDAKTHYHKKLTELYLILEGVGQMELDGDLIPVKPFTAIMIKPRITSYNVCYTKLLRFVLDHDLTGRVFRHVGI